MSRLWQRAQQVGMSPEAAGITRAVQADLAQLNAQFPGHSPEDNAQLIFTSLTDEAKRKELRRVIGGMTLFEKAALMITALDDDEASRLLEATQAEIHSRMEHQLLIEQTRTEAINSGIIDLSKLPTHTAIQLDLYPYDDFAEVESWEELHIRRGFRPVMRMMLSANEDATFKVLTIAAGSYGLLRATPVNELPQEMTNILIGSPDMTADFGINQILYWDSEVVYAGVDREGGIQNRQVFAVQQTPLGLGGAWMNGIQLFSDKPMAQQNMPSKPPLS